MNVKQQKTTELTTIKPNKMYKLSDVLEKNKVHLKHS